jgi:hypothetical protein
MAFNRFKYADLLDLLAGWMLARSAIMQCDPTRFPCRSADGGMEAAEAAEQTVKDWAALSAEEKAEYEVQSGLGLSLKMLRRDGIASISAN